MRRAAFIVLAGCWSSSTAPPPPKPAPPVERAHPPGTRLLGGAPMKAFPAGGVVDAQMQLSAPVAPWTAIESGHLDPAWHVLHLAAGGKDYVMTLGAGAHGGVLFPMLYQRDIVPGGPLEVIAELIMNNDGGSSSIIAVCGIGRSGVPTCATFEAIHSFDDELEVEFPATGGVDLVTSEKTTKLWFEFP